MKVSTVTTLKAQVRDTLSFVNYYLNSGIDHMYLFFDNPEDECIPILRGYENLSVFKCDTKHWKALNIDPGATVQTKQEANATLAFELSKKSDIDWLVHIDSDELIYGNISISEYFKEIPDDTDVIRFPVLEATPQKMYYDCPFEDIVYFKCYTALHAESNGFYSTPKDIQLQKRTRLLWHLKRLVARLFGSKSASEIKFLLGHQDGKSAIRTTANIRSIKNHLPAKPISEFVSIAVSQNFYVIHYDCMGFENWYKKWANRIHGINNFNSGMLSKHRQELTSKIEQAIDNEKGLQQIYKELYYLSNYEKNLLKTLGLLKKIKLENQLFDGIKPNLK